MSYMQEALKLAEQGRFGVAPNPMVGCIIERNNTIVGRGWHQKTGLAHAEVIALEEAGEKAQNANVYLTLEPCSHYGRTPPCVDKLIAAKIKSIHIPFIDPNPLVNGRSVDKLKAAGIDVYIGEEADAARKQNEVFLHYITTQRPYVVAKWAMSLDGRIATDSGDSKWISCTESREHAHYSRCWLGAVLIGAGTVIADDPNLTPYLIKNPSEYLKYPTRIILDSKGIIPLHVKVFQPGSKSKTLVATTEQSSAEWRQKLINQNVDVLVLATNKHGTVDLNNLLEELGKIEISGLLVEGGQAILTSFFKERLVNKVHTYIAPKIIGGNKLRSPIADLNISQVMHSLKLQHEKHELLGDDIFVSSKIM